MCADIVVVGGGPVGLWAAIQAKKRNPDLDVQVYERYPEYERQHVLKLEHSSMLLYAKSTGDEAERTFLESVTGKKKLSRVFMSAAGAGNVFIRTDDLENALKQYAADLGININYRRINSPDEAEQLHPECTNFIAADGAHSKMREALLGKDSVKNFPLQYVVELKYQADGKAGELSTRSNFKLNKKLSSMAFEYVGRERDGITPVTLRFFVNEATYKAMPEASFRNPVKLGDPQIPQSLADDIDAYMKQRATKTHETYKPGSAKMSKLTLSLYRANSFAVERGKTGWFIAGDAAMGVPYFRSLNAGLVIGSQLGFILTRRDVSNKAKVNAYNLVKPLDTAWEFTAARGKDMVLKIYDLIRRPVSKPKQPHL